MYWSHFSTKKIEYIPKYSVRPGSLEMLCGFGHSSRIYPSRKLQSFSRYDWSFQNLSFFVILFLIFRFLYLHYFQCHLLFLSPARPISFLCKCIFMFPRESSSFTLSSCGSIYIILLLNPSSRPRTQDRAHIPLATQTELGKDMWSRCYN